MNIGENIKNIRKEKKITQQELAYRIGKSKSTIEKYEAGKVENIPYSTIKDIAIALDVSTDDICTPVDTTKLLKNAVINLQNVIENELKLKNDDDFNKLLLIKSFVPLFERLNISLSRTDSDDFNKIKLIDNKDGYTKIFDTYEEAEHFFNEITHGIQSSIDRLKYYDKNNK